MARLAVRNGRLVLVLNAIEKFADLRLHNPSVALAAVRRISVLSNPGALIDEVDLGFHGNTTPGRGAVTAYGRGRYCGGRAAVFVYFRRRSVRVDIDETGGGWRLFIVSCREADASAYDLNAQLEIARGGGSQ